MLTFIKLGGSLITNKTQEKSFRKETVQRIADEIKQFLIQNPDEQLLIGHGSGSFGHYAAKRYNTINGVKTPQEWIGFAEVAVVASELNQMVAAILHDTGIPVWRISPSASAICQNKQITVMATQSIQVALDNGIVPLVHGDVAIDEAIGGTIISTEAVFSYLATQFSVQQMLLLGEVDGVYDQSGSVISEITPQNFPQMVDALGGSHGTDVTGGMIDKVQQMLTLAQKVKGLQIRVINGIQPNLLLDVLTSNKTIGTLIHAPS